MNQMNIHHLYKDYLNGRLMNVFPNFIQVKKTIKYNIIIFFLMNNYMGFD